MIFIKTKFSGLLIIEPSYIKDERGNFQETFRLNALEKELGYKIFFCQENESNSKKDVLKGLHFQKPPYEQSKLIRVVEGEILDIVVDVRKDSPTYSKYYSIKLSSENNLQLFIPKGFAHGYLTLSKSAKILYKVDSYYNKYYESGIKYNDKFLNIDWNINSKIIISDKDKNQPYFKII